MPLETTKEVNAMNATSSVARSMTSHRLAIALVAILSMFGALFVLPGTAHAVPATVTVEDGSSITLGSIGVVLGTDCVDSASGTPLRITPWECPGWDVTGGVVDSVDVNASALWVADGVAAMLDDSIVVNMSDAMLGDCTISIEGSRLLIFDSGTGTYDLEDVVGTYALSDCSGGLTLAIGAVLGASPSNQALDVALDITVT